MQGRVNTTGRMLSWGLGSPIGALLGGVVGGALGPQYGILLGAVVLSIVTAFAWGSSLRGIPVRRPLAVPTS